MQHSTVSTFSRARGFMVALLRHGARLHLAQAAASLTFLSLLAIVPVVSIAISLLGALPMLAELRLSAMQFIATNLFLPSFSDTIVGYLNEFAEKVGELSALGAAMFFATAFSALRTIDDTLNRLWETGRPRSLVRRMTIYWTFLTLGPVLLAAGTAVNTLVFSEWLSGVSLPALKTAWVALLPWLTTIGGLTLLYRMVPNAPVGWRDALLGAIVAALTLELLKRGMGVQLARLPTYTIVYGAFAALPIFFIWIFLLWLTVLGGALVVASLPAWSQAQPLTLAETPAARFWLSRCVLERIMRATQAGEIPVFASEFRALFGGDAFRARQTIEVLVELGYLQRLWRTDDPTIFEAGTLWEESWMLAQGGAQQALRPLFNRIWSGTGGAAHDALDPLAFEPELLSKSLMELASRN